MLGSDVADHVVERDHVGVPAGDQDLGRLGAGGGDVAGRDVVGEEVVRDEVVVPRDVDDAVEVVEAFAAADERRVPLVGRACSAWLAVMRFSLQPFTRRSMPG